MVKSFDFVRFTFKFFIDDGINECFFLAIPTNHFFLFTFVFLNNKNNRNRMNVKKDAQRKKMNSYSTQESYSTIA